MKATMSWLEAMIVNQTNAHLLGGWTRLYIKYYYKKFMNGLKETKIWQLKLEVMDHKTKLSDASIIKLLTF
jgi:hypothetical protein